MSVDGVVKAGALLGGQGWSGGPGLVGRRSGGAVRASGGVGFGLSNGDVVATPRAGPAVACQCQLARAYPSQRRPYAKPY
jgi:hypothetical protein